MVGWVVAAASVATLTFVAIIETLIRWDGAADGFAEDDVIVFTSSCLILEGSWVTAVVSNDLNSLNQVG